MCRAAYSAEKKIKNGIPELRVCPRVGNTVVATIFQQTDESSALRYHFHQPYDIPHIGHSVTVYVGMSRFDRTAGDGFHQADDILNIRCSVAVDIAERDIRITVYLRRKACRPENGVRVRFKQRCRASDTSAPTLDESSSRSSQSSPPSPGSCDSINQCTSIFFVRQGKVYILLRQICSVHEHEPAPS